VEHLKIEKVSTKILWWIRISTKCYNRTYLSSKKQRMIGKKSSRQRSERNLKIDHR